MARFPEFRIDAIYAIALMIMVWPAFDQPINIRDGSSRYTTNIGPGVVRSSEYIQPTSFAQGDVNADGVVSLVDAILIKNYLLEVIELDSEFFARADANNDGKVTMADLVYVNTHISPAVISDNAIFVDDEPELTVTTVNLPEIILKWSGPDSPPISVGDVISGTDPAGFMRKVTSVDIKDQKVTLQTGPASMSEAIEAGQFSASITFDDSEPVIDTATSTAAMVPRLQSDTAGANWNLSGMV